MRSFVCSFGSNFSFFLLLLMVALFLRRFCLLSMSPAIVHSVGREGDAEHFYRDEE